MASSVPSRRDLALCTELPQSNLELIVSGTELSVLHRLVSVSVAGCPPCRVVLYMANGLPKIEAKIAPVSRE